MQLSFDAADRLVELVEARHGAIPVDEAARTLFALQSAPTAIARSLLEDVVADDARLSWRGSAVALAGVAGLDVPLEQAELVVFDLETTGLSPVNSRICEIGAQRVRALELDETFEMLVDPGTTLPSAVAALTGLRPEDLRGAPRSELAVRRLLSFTGEAALVAHNARFDMAFLDREVQRLTGRRVAAPVIDTVWLARRLLGDRTRRVGLAALANFFGVPTEPCHRALPDARATAEILIRLIGLAQERGAGTVGDLVELAAPRARRLHARRSLVAEAPTRPGVYRFLDHRGTTLYVGRARDLRRRLRSYFADGRQRPAVEAALGALASVRWEETGSELEAALLELELIRSLRPAANVRGLGARRLYLARRGSDWVVSEKPTPLGPLGSRRVARAAARGLAGHDDPERAIPALRARLARLAADQRFEDAARIRDRLAALERVNAELERLARLRALETCLLVPDRRPGFARGFAVTAGRVAATRAIPHGPGAWHEAAALVAEAALAHPSDAAEDVDALTVVDGTLRRPPPELVVVDLDADAIARRMRPLAFAA